MSERLRVDTSVLIEAGAALRVVAQEFADANSHSDEVADAIGDPGLAGAVRSFAHNWDDRRAKMLSEIARLAEATSLVGESFSELDRALGAALRGEPTP